MNKKAKILIFIIFFLSLFTTISKASFTVIDNTGNTTSPKTYIFEDIPSAYKSNFDKGYLIRQYNGVFYFVLYKENTLCYAKNGVMEINNVVYLSYNKNTQKYNLESNNCSANGDVADYIYYNGDIYTDSEKTDYYFKVLDNKILPSILDSDDNLRLLNMTNLLIDTGNINIKEGYFDFLIRTKPLGSSDDFVTVYHAKLDKNSSFYKTGGINGDYYEISVDIFKNLLTKGNLISYDLLWLEEGKDISETASRSVIFGYESTETNDILNNNFKNLFNLITKQALEEVSLSQKQHEESQETQKGILATIKEVVSYINPFSENFFVYKLIDLLIEALKSLFIPGDEFFSNYFNELKEWFSNRFGFLAYPLDLVLDILNRILNINFTEPAFNIPEIKEPITNTNLISATSFNFNTLLENETLKTVHDTYLILVDAVIIFALVNLAKTKFEEVMTK